MTTPPTPRVAEPMPSHQEVTACGRCGRRFPQTDDAGLDTTSYCEPCRAEMWAADHTVVTDVNVPTRQCGRCRKTFAGDPSLHREALAEWWVCPECRTVLFGAGR